MSNKRCNECGASNVVIGKYCDLCAPHMVEQLVEVDDSVSLNNKEYVMSELGYGNAWASVEESVSIYCNVRCDEEGNELGVNDVVTPQLTNVSVMSEWVEDNVVDLGDRIGNAELCIWEDDSDMYYERDFGDVINGIAYEPIMVSYTPFISKEQQGLNLSFYTEKVRKAKTLGELAIIAKMILGAQKKEDNGMFFFAAGMSKVFWSTYNARKAEVQTCQKYLVLEIEDLICGATYPSKLKRIKIEIYDAKITYLEKRRLWDECDKKIAQISA